MLTKISLEVYRNKIKKRSGDLNHRNAFVLLKFSLSCNIYFFNNFIIIDEISFMI